MKTLVTKGIILSRTEFGEADRIITVITPDHGKLRLIVKGVRRMKSKMAGGIELFSVNQLSYLKGKGEIGTMISARSDIYFPNIVKEIERVQLGYDLIKMTNRATEDNTEEEYFDLLFQGYEALDDTNIKLELIKFWFQVQLLKLAGYTPNLYTDTSGKKLHSDKKYFFDFDEMAFTQKDNGQFKSDQIKLLRIAFNGNKPVILAKIGNIENLTSEVAPSIQTMFQTHIRI